MVCIKYMQWLKKKLNSCNLKQLLEERILENDQDYCGNFPTAVTFCLQKKRKKKNYSHSKKNTLLTEHCLIFSIKAAFLQIYSQRLLNKFLYLFEKATCYLI